MATRSNLQVIVVGGGIAGLTMALSLHQAGIAVRIYEAVREPRALGVGINLLPTAVRELTELGLGGDLARTGIATRELVFFNKFGQLISREERGLSAGYKWPQYSIHRGHLQQLLLRAVCKRIGGENFRSGLRFTEFEQIAGRVVTRFHDRESGSSELDEADVLIGADGIHSAVRRQLHPSEGKPSFARQVLWRSAVDAEPYLDGATMIIAGSVHQRIVVYPMACGARPGQLLTNWVCQMGASGHTCPDVDWDRRVAKDAVASAFAGWRFPVLDIPALIERASDIYEFPLVDRDPVDGWSFGRVTLIGDAAHPMWPFGSQAGSQAIVDARVLAGLLLTTSDPAEALQRYDMERRPIMNDIVLRNRSFGPEAAMDLAEERAPNGFSDIEDVISPQELEDITSSFSLAAGLDTEAVNGRPSFVPQRCP
jgi:2-polyprenyl-6-methoxyphenol hydroxylase-like FAD-dependent oxidoreductase